MLVRLLERLRLRQPVLPTWEGEDPDLVLLHIGKTGGTALRDLLQRNRAAGRGRKVVMLRHRFGIAQAAKEYPRAKLGFVVRDPIERATSGFYSRLRKGQPRHTSDWSPAEEIAFSRYTDMESLALDLGEGRPEAKAAFEAITHVSRGLAHFLGSREVLEAHRDRITFIGRQSLLEEDVARLVRAQGLDPAIGLPTSDVAAHRAPGQRPPPLSPQAEASLREVYARDYEIYDWCLARRAELIGDG